MPVKPENQRKAIRANLTKELNLLPNLLRDTKTNEKSLHAILQKLLHYQTRNAELSNAFQESLKHGDELTTEIDKDMRESCYIALPAFNQS